MLRLTISLVVLLGLSLPAAATTGPRYVCTFENGATWTYEDDKFQNNNNANLSFEIADISRKTQSAQLKTKNGVNDLKVVIALDALHFIEVTVSGYLNMTTLYGEGDRIPAVHSRHLGIVGQPVGGQMTGFCERKSS